MVLGEYLLIINKKGEFSLKGFAIFLYVVAFGLVVFGLITMFNYGDYNVDTNPLGSQTGHIVGGDAYNYTIIALRGAGLITAGVVVAVIGNGLIALESLNQRSTTSALNEIKSDITSSTSL